MENQENLLSIVDIAEKYHFETGERGVRSTERRLRYYLETSKVKVPFSKKENKVNAERFYLVENINEILTTKEENYKPKLICRKHSDSDKYKKSE